MRNDDEAMEHNDGHFFFETRTPQSLAGITCLSSRISIILVDKCAVHNVMYAFLAHLC